MGLGLCGDWLFLADVDGRNYWLGRGGPTSVVLFCRYLYFVRSAGRLSWDSCGCSRKLLKQRIHAGG